MSATLTERIFTRVKELRHGRDSSQPLRILLTEGHDQRMRDAAAKIAALGLARIDLLATDPLTLSGVNVINPLTSELRKELSKDLQQIKIKDKTVSSSEAEKLLNNPLYFGASLLKQGLVDVAVSGATNTTADVLRTGLHILEKAPVTKSISSFFLMILRDGRALTYADCGVIPYPTSEQLAEIAILAAKAHAKLTGETPHVAMLSFSTYGSAKHPSVELVTNALSLAKQRAPQLLIDGELQFDAASIPDVAARKAPKSAVAGKANVFIFPNLDAGNIAYKITERLAGATAVGPILQGFKQPWLDLSRGCTANDIVLVAAVGAILSKE